MLYKRTSLGGKYMQHKLNHTFMDFVTKSPTAYQALDTAYDLLSREGTVPFVSLKEGEPVWEFQPGLVHAVSRNGSAAAFFRIPESDLDQLSFKIAAVHLDSPALKVKRSPEVFDHGYIRLNVEGYGGMIRPSWFDRPLSVAGRIFVLEDGKIKEELVDLRRTLKCTIPSLAIHKL